MAEWNYEKIGEDGKTETAPIHDLDGKITGKCILNLRCWFDENPEIRVNLGYIKHIRHYPDELNYDSQTQYVQRGLKENSDFEVEDVLTAVDKSVEMMQYEEIFGQSSIGGGITFTSEGIVYATRGV